MVDHYADRAIRPRLEADYHKILNTVKKIRSYNAAITWLQGEAK